MSETARQKRVNRRVAGRLQRFFVSTQPGLESLCLAELQNLFPGIEDMQLCKGGIEFSGKLPACYLANVALHTARRILMRIHDFRAENFRMLERNLRNVDWELFLPVSGPLRIHVSACKSRLYHSGAIAARVAESIGSRLPYIQAETGRGARKTGAQHIFVRLEQNRIAISIDSSGDLLHKRGIKTGKFPAPIRETAAAAALIRAGYRGTGVLVDPMCGSGAITIEAALMAQGVPPGWYRRFAFMQWPAFRESHWEAIRENARQRFCEIDVPVIFASDIDPRCCRALQKTCDGIGWSKTVNIEQHDFFHISGKNFKGPKGLLMINPPYGIRLPHPESRAIFFRRLAAHLAVSFCGWNVGVILPEKNLRRFFPPPFQSLPLFHGGLHLTLLTGRLPD
jgi:putative N6-adenine-specific DNA methylase